MQLDQRQEAAASATEGRVAVVAGPGSGKSRVLVERIKRMIAAGTHPSTIVAMTFTVRAADELIDRLDGAALGFCGTIHGFARHLLLRYPDQHPLGSNFSILDEHDSADLYRGARDELRLRTPLRTLRSRIDAMARSGGDPDELPAEDSSEGIEARRLLLAYRQSMDRLRACDFDSLIRYARNLILREPEAAESIHRQYAHASIDEYQDVSPEQDHFVDLCFPPHFAVPGSGRSVFVVADPCQSIYGWRGGDPRLFLEKAKHAHTSVTLARNYRSLPPIVALANRVAADDPLRTPAYVLEAVRGD